MSTHIKRIDLTRDYNAHREEYLETCLLRFSEEEGRKRKGHYISLLCVCVCVCVCVCM